ncbi:hypothetical protein [Alishewanella longhuensis]|nr:hypothetical protein [Alishewanella longhuensis]
MSASVSQQKACSAFPVPKITLLSAALFSFTVASGAQAADCAAALNDVNSHIPKLQSSVSNEAKGGQQDFSATTSSNYSKKIYDAFEALNKNASQASALTNQAYDLSKNSGVMSEGQVQTKMPPQVTISMANAVQLAEAAAKESNTKLDLAQLRCDQNTEDAALGAYLNQASSATQTTYRDTKREACKVVHVLAELQDARQKLNDIRQNGYPIFHLHVQDKKTFANQYKRTVQMKVDLRMYPTYPSTVDVKGSDQTILLGQVNGINLSYNSYFKWSDDNWTKLNLFQKIMGDTKRDDYQCLPPAISLGSASVELCIKLDNFTDNSLTVHAQGKFRYHSDTHSIALGSKDVPAPFGYLAKVSDMKEKKMQDLQSKLAKRLLSLLGVHSELLDKASHWKNSCS